MPILSISASRASCSSRCLFTWLMTIQLRAICPRKERDMGTMSPFMLKMGTRSFCGVGTALIGPVLPANGASPEIGNQLDLTVGERTHVAARQHKHANRRSFSQQRNAEHGVVFADFFWCSIIRYSRNEPISAIRSSC